MAYKTLSKLGYSLKKIFSNYIFAVLFIGVSLSPSLIFVSSASAAITYCSSSTRPGASKYPCPDVSQTQGQYYCGDPGSNPIHTSIDFGCEHKGTPMLDLIFSIIRILSDGVGIVIAASLIVAGIQYSASAGDPNSVNTAVKRIRSNVLALLIYIFAYALLNFIVPGQVLK